MKVIAKVLFVAAIFLVVNLDRAAAQSDLSRITLGCDVSSTTKTIAEAWKREIALKLKDLVDAADRRSIRVAVKFSPMERISRFDFAVSEYSSGTSFNASIGSAPSEFYPGAINLAVNSGSLLFLPRNTFCQVKHRYTIKALFKKTNPVTEKKEKYLLSTISGVIDIEGRPVKK